MATLPRKVAMRTEVTGNAAQDRAQRMAQEVGKAHEQTKAYVLTLEQTVDDLTDTVAAQAARIAIMERTTGVGRTTVPMGNVNTTATAAQAACQLLAITGAHTAIRTLTLPSATDATAYVRVISNLTTGGFAITITTPTGGSASVANGATKFVAVTNAATSAIT